MEDIMKDGDAPLKAKKTKWVKTRHAIIQKVAAFVAGPIFKWMYNCKVEPYKGDTTRPMLILYNHQTPFDQFYVGLTFKIPVYYVSTEDLHSRGWLSSLIRWAVAPIAIRKQASDVGAVRNCLRVAREGGTIAIAPEGNRTYSGKTEYMSPAIVTLARVLKLPVALLRIEGGYGIIPRWSDKQRRGHMRVFVPRVIEPEEYAALSDEELFRLISDTLYVDDHELNQQFISKRGAEYLERAIYTCPDCGLTRYESHGNEAKCLKCGKAVAYGADMHLTGVGHEFPYKTVSEWYDRQKDFINALDVTKLVDEPVYEETADVYEIIASKNRKLLCNGTTLQLYGDRITVSLGDGEPTTMTFDDVFAAAVLGRNKLNIYYQDHIYQFKGDKRFNSLKYVHFCYRWKNKDKDEPDGKFLGL